MENLNGSPVLSILSLALLMLPCLAQERQSPPRNAEERLVAAERLELERISAVVRGRCVDAATGKPLVGCVVELHCSGRRDLDLPLELVRPEAVTTGDDGTFAVRVLARETFQVSLEITMEGRWPRTGRWRYMLPGETDDLGAIPLHEGVRAVGKVVDAAGQPVAGMTVGIDKLPLFVGVESDPDAARSLEDRLRAGAVGGIGRAFHPFANRVRYAVTQADGTFESPDALPPGTYPIKISDGGLELAEPQTITIPERGPMQPVTIVVKQEPFIGGIVVDEKGEPVAGVQLMGVHTGGGRSCGSRTDGSFKLYRFPDAPDRMALRIIDPGPCETAPPTEEFAWGKADIEIVLRRALSVEVEVVEVGTGAPVEAFAIRCYPTTQDFYSGFRRLRHAGRHAGGKLIVDSVRRGPVRFVVVPDDPQLAVRQVDTVGQEGMAPIRIEVPRLVAMMVQVLDPNGAPAANVEVLVIEPGNEASLPGRVTINDPRSDNMGAFSSSPNVTFDTKLSTARTDGGGQCVVYGLDGRDDLILGLRRGDEKLQRVTDVTLGKEHKWRQVRLERE